MMGSMTGPRGAAKRGTARLAPWSPTASREEVRAYVQQRLAMFSKVWFWCFSILIVFVIGLYEVYPSIRPARAEVVLAAAATGLGALAVVWSAVLHRGKPSLDTLYLIDAIYAVCVGVILGMSVYFQSELPPATYSALVWHTFWVFSRVIIMPSSARRTAVITSISFLPLALAGILMAALYPERIILPRFAFIFGDLLYVVVAVVLSTVGSHVMYGLRRAASEARQLGQYTLAEKIGAGGMGEVYRARHAMLRRPTAVKLLPPEKYGVEAVRRFEREVQHMSQLTHPNTVAIFDYGRSPDGVFYYAMEYLDGIDLGALVRREGPQPAARVIHILQQVCGALDEAHAMGLTHRDIKPENVILCQRGRTPDVAKVVDFGLVKELTRDTSDTASKVIAGTPAYLAPEAVTDPAAVGPQSDLYSLGAVGYYLLTGQRVFEGKTAVDVCVQHATAAVVPPSQRTTNPVPAELEALLLACLAKAPADRPASAEAMRLALTRMPAYADWDEPRARAWWKAFDTRRAEVAAARADEQPPLTITVDIADRAVADQPRTTAQVTK